MAAEDMYNERPVSRRPEKRPRFRTSGKEDSSRSSKSKGGGVTSLPSSRIDEIINTTDVRMSLAEDTELQNQYRTMEYSPSTDVSSWLEHQVILEQSKEATPVPLNRSLINCCVFTTLLGAAFVVFLYFGCRKFPCNELCRIAQQFALNAFSNETFPSRLNFSCN